MRYIRFVVLLAAWAARATPAQSPPRYFVPAVEFPDTAARCAEPPANLPTGERGYSLRFGTADSSERIVTAIWSDNGKLIRYSDARGDLRPPFPANAPRNPKTTITIDVPRQVVLMYNDVDGEQQGSAASDSEGALDADNLGPPRRMLERLRRQCAAP
jgi:hypothetical protein